MNKNIGEMTNNELKDFIIELQEQNSRYERAIAKIKDKLLCYGETFDSNIHQQFQKECLQIIDKVGDNNE